MDNTRNVSGDGAQMEVTGRYLVLLPEQTTRESLENMRNVAGLNLASSSDFQDQAFTESDIQNSDGIFLEKLGVVIINDRPDKISAITSAESTQNMIIEQERVVYALIDEKYILGYRDGINALCEQVLQGKQISEFELEPSLEEQDGQTRKGLLAYDATWGLKSTLVIPPPLRIGYSGTGVKVAILDTGFDFSHPDFQGKSIINKTFIPGQDVQDLHGHGTHCAGTVCGPLNPLSSDIQRYGIAYNAQLYIGKVLSNQGSGSDGSILAGINWAISQGCKVISMSLGAPAFDSSYSQVFENSALRALNQGSLIVAAAGNDSRRPSQIRPVSHPANCPSIMAVGAIAQNGTVAPFSNGGRFSPHGSVDIIAPGLDVFSSYKMPEKYAILDGTSMATPHVAGIAALYSEAFNLSGHALWNKLIQSAKRLKLPSSDVGAGLVQAPSKSTIHVPINSGLPKKLKEPASVEMFANQM